MGGDAAGGAFATQTPIAANALLATSASVSTPAATRFARRVWKPKDVEGQHGASSIGSVGPAALTVIKYPRAQ